MKTIRIKSNHYLLKRTRIPQRRSRRAQVVTLMPAEPDAEPDSESDAEPDSLAETDSPKPYNEVFIVLLSLR